MKLPEYLSTLFDAVERGPESMRPYQNQAVEFLTENPYSALFIDVGMGKSVISLTAILNLITQTDFHGPWLVIAPKRVAAETWPTEIRQWRHTAPITFAHIRDEFVVDAVNAAGREARKEIVDELFWEGLSKDEIRERIKDNDLKTRIEKARIKASAKAVREHFKRNPAVVHIISRDHVEFLVNAWGRNWPYRGVIVDESSSLKDHTTARFKALRRVRPLIKRLHELTATPCAETYLHLFPQIFLLDEGQRFGSSVTKYRERYFTQNRYTFKWTLRPEAEQEISAKIADLCLVMKAEDYLDLEKPQSLIDKVYLTAEQEALYRKMEEDYVVTLPSGDEVEAETAAELSQKLLQMASGVLYENRLEEKPDGTFRKRRVVHSVHDHKLEALENIVEETEGECLMVCYWHDSSYDRLKRAFPKAVAMDKEGKCVKDWNKRKIPILLVHPQSAGHGLNMQLGGRRIVFFDIPWSLELYLQVIGRLAGARQLARKEDERVVFLHHIVCHGTLDEAVVQALSEKNDAQEILFRLIKALRRKWSKQKKVTSRV